MLRSTLGRIASFLCLAVLAPQALAAPLYLWEARRGDSVAYLFGSVHLCSDACYPLPPRVLAALDDSRALAVEIDASRPEALAPMVGRATYGDGDGVDNHLPAAVAGRYKRALLERGVPEPVARRMKPWFGTLMLEILALQGAGFAAEKGIDLHLIGMARSAGKPIVELETLDDQIRALERVSAEDQSAMTRLTLDMLDDGTLADYLQGVMQAWRSGDPQRLYERSLAVFPDQKAGRRAMNALLAERNRGMAQRVAQFASRHERLFVVVGAGHLAGPGSLQQELEAAGFRVRQLTE